VGGISEISNFLDLKKFVEQNIQNISADRLLLVFDIDETIMSHDNIYYKTKDMLREELKNNKISTNSYWDYASIVIRDHKIEPMHEFFPAWVNSLQERDIKTICLTHAMVDRVGNIESGLEFRLDQVFSIDFDFSGQFPDYAKEDTREFFENRERFLFYKGVLFTNLIKSKIFVKNHEIKSKGLILYRFLEDLYESIGWRPSKIIFIDDKIDFVNSVSVAMKAMGIDFVGGHYIESRNKYSEQSFCPQSRINRQFETLIKERRWVSAPSS